MANIGGNRIAVLVLRNAVLAFLRILGLKVKIVELALSDSPNGSHIESAMSDWQNSWWYWDWHGERFGFRMIWVKNLKIWGYRNEKVGGWRARYRQAMDKGPCPKNCNDAGR